MFREADLKKNGLETHILKVQLYFNLSSMFLEQFVMQKMQTQSKSSCLHTRTTEKVFLRLLKNTFYMFLSFQHKNTFCVKCLLLRYWRTKNVCLMWFSIAVTPNMNNKWLLTQCSKSNLSYLIPYSSLIRCHHYHHNICAHTHNMLTYTALILNYNNDLPKNKKTKFDISKR